MCIRNASISTSPYSHNRAVENGGVFAVDGSQITIQCSSFNYNTTGTNGGVLNSEYFLFVSHTSFTKNWATEQGGVMYLGRKGSKVRINRSENNPT